MPVWGGCSKEDIDSLQVLQNRAARIATRLPTRTNREKMFQQTGWLSVKQMIVYFSTRQCLKQECLVIQLNWLGFLEMRVELEG